MSGFRVYGVGSQRAGEWCRVVALQLLRATGMQFWEGRRVKGGFFQPLQSVVLDWGRCIPCIWDYFHGSDAKYWFFVNVCGGMVAGVEQKVSPNLPPPFFLCLFHACCGHIFLRFPLSGRVCKFAIHDNWSLCTDQLPYEERKCEFRMC